MAETRLLDAAFERAVAALDAGDVPALERLIADDARLVTERLKAPGAWLRDRVGHALKGFFARPYLLWFVAEDPVRRDRVPDNVVDVIRAIVAAAKRAGAVNVQEQLDYCLRLVAWSWVAARCNRQLDMIDALVDAGASPKGEPNNALVNGHFAAAERLIARGAPVDLASALCLGRWADVDRLAPHASAKERRFAFVLAALNGQAEAVKRMVALGVDVNAPSDGLYSHGTPLHHAVCSGSLDTVRALVDAGANVRAVDTAWNGTPLGWAHHYQEESTGERRDRYSAIAQFLEEREQQRHSPASNSVAAR